MRKAIIIVIIVIILLVLVVFRIQSIRRSRTAEIEKLPLPVGIMIAEYGDVSSTCEVLGSITARKTAQVFPETRGRITRILVKEGSRVHKNGRLMALRNEAIGFDYQEGFIKSPISGSVAKIMVDIGSMVTPQIAVAEVVDYSTVSITFVVAETDIACVSKKNTVSVTIDALPKEIFTAKITEISPVIDPLTKTVHVKAGADNQDRMLKPGMTARITISLGQKENVLVVPKSAFRNGFVFVVEDSITEKRAVTTGITGDMYIEIIEGLAVGERIVVVGQERLTGEEKVNPIEADK
ncbi:MAG: efflux RND transporter periplasmic adaptor subunit [Candidatus Cloacimonadota bacterium]|nr:MAG: efflux RND transporter periplasmic adaptor subunit [Candidatus Cloacimonadota bacterium]